MADDSEIGSGKQPLNGSPYYKRYPRDFIEGTALLPFEAKGAYAVLLDLIYIQNGELPDDPRYIAGVLGCSVRKWKIIRQTLLDHGKIYEKRGLIRNYRADKMVLKLKLSRDNNAENAAKRWKNKDLADAVASKKTSHRARDPDNRYIEASASMTDTGSAGRTGGHDGLIENKAPRRPVDQLWQDYVDQVASLTGKTDKQARPLIGRWLKEAKDDAGLVMTAINAAVEKQPFDPISWISGAINNRKGQAGIAQRMSDEIDKIKSEGGW